MTHLARKQLAVASLLLIFLLPNVVRASETNGTIDTTFKYAWSDNAGWINFGASTGDVHVVDTAITGFAWSNNYGWINMSPTNAGVTNNGEGVLGGFAWGASLGWIDFSGISIDQNGHFHGTATGSNIGALTFDCTNCAVVTDWRPISVRTPTTPPAPPGNGGGGGGGGGGGAISGPLSFGFSNTVPIPGFPSTGSVTPTPESLPIRTTKQPEVPKNDLSASAFGISSSTQEAIQNFFDAGVEALSSEDNSNWTPWAAAALALSFVVAFAVGVWRWYRNRIP